jgi:hypothetical protein
MGGRFEQKSFFVRFSEQAGLNKLKQAGRSAAGVP